MYKQELSKISPKVTEVEDIGSRSPSVGTSLLPFTLLATHSFFDAMLGLLGSIVEGYQTPNILKDHVRVRWTCVIAPFSELVSSFDIFRNVENDYSTTSSKIRRELLESSGKN
jgi:hypothetical protein